MIFMNEEALEYRAPNGTAFKSERCDLRSVVKVISKRKLQPHLLAQDLVAFGAYHAHYILPLLNGFPGYDAVSYEPMQINEQKDQDSDE